MRILALLGGMCLLAGCGQRDGYKVCFGAPASGNCRVFESEKHFERWSAAEDIRKKAVAQRFPDDYRDIVAITLNEFVQTNGSQFENVKDQFFVYVFGEDIDSVTQQKLLSYGVKTEPGSKYVETYGTEKFRIGEGEYLWNTRIRVSDIERQDNGDYEVRFGYSCGLQCAGGLRWVLRNEKDAWVFVSKNTLWVS